MNHLSSVELRGPIYACDELRRTVYEEGHDVSCCRWAFLVTFTASHTYEPALGSKHWDKSLVCTMAHDPRSWPFTRGEDLWISRLMVGNQFQSDFPHQVSCAWLARDAGCHASFILLLLLPTCRPPLFLWAWRRCVDWLVVSISSTLHYSRGFSKLKKRLMLLVSCWDGRTGRVHHHLGRWGDSKRRPFMMLVVLSFRTKQETPVDDAMIEL